MRLLGVPVSVFTLDTKAPYPANQKRLDGFKEWYTAADADKDLRRAALALQLTLHATSITAPQKGDVPMLVRLGRGEVQKKTSDDLCRILPLLGTDLVLDIAATVVSLLSTECHILARFGEYNKYPTRLWKLCRFYNSAGYVHEIECFLATRAEDLDCGYSLTLQREALAQGMEERCLAFMVSEDVQDELRDIFLRASATSLDVERKHNQDKQSERRRLSGVASASRNSIIARYRLMREGGLRSEMQRRNEPKRNATMNLRALAIQRNPGLFSRAMGRRFSSRGHMLPSDIIYQGDDEALRQYIQEHKRELQSEAADLRENAKRQRPSVIPFTNAEWLEWLDQNDEYFRGQLRVATAARRHLNQRIIPLHGGLPEEPRLFPVRARTQVQDLWMKILLQQQPGFFLHCGCGIDWQIGVLCVLLSWCLHWFSACSG